MSSSSQNVGLQSLRGIAALVVLVHHASYFYPMSYQARVVLDTVLNAHAAIIFFFVLSGFVLVNSLIRYGSATSFYIKRAFRILPAFWLTTAICAAYVLIFGTQPGSTVLNWPGGMITEPSWTPKMIVSALAGVPVLMGSAYTICAEILGSAAIPPLLYLFRRNTRFAIVLIVALAGMSFWLYDAPNSTRYLMFLVHFALGLFAALIFKRERPFTIWAPLTIIFLCGLIFSRQIFMVAYTGTLQELDYAYHLPSSGLLEGLFSAALIVAVASGKGSMLDNSLLVWIGDISYSIYLMHLPALFLSARFAGSLGIETAQLQFAITITLALLITFVASALMYRFVEKPCIVIGERLALQKFGWSPMKRHRSHVRQEQIPPL